MAVVVTCPQCLKQHNLPSDMVGQTINCKECSYRFEAAADVRHNTNTQLKTMVGWIAALAVLGIGFIIFSRLIGGLTVPVAPASRSVETGILVGWQDNTETNKLHSRAEVWFKGGGSWFMTNSGDTKLMPLPVGGRGDLHIYPDGRDGAEIRVPLMLTSEMNARGSERDLVMISISDSTVTVSGSAVQAGSQEASLEVAHPR